MGKKKQKTIKPKKETVKKISFLSQRKTVSDKFFDLLQKETKTVYNYKREKWIRHGIGKFAKTLGVSVNRINTIIKKGSVSDNGDYLITGVEKLHNKLKLPKTKKTTKEFTVHNFTRTNFFKRKPFGKIKKNEQLYFRCGLYLEFSKKDKQRNFTDVTGYTIQNLPISHHSNLYPKGYDEFFEIIKIKLQDFPSLKFFRFNYFDVTKIDIGFIEDRLKIFQDKFKGKLKSKPKKKK